MTKGDAHEFIGLVRSRTTSTIAEWNVMLWIEKQLEAEMPKKRKGKGGKKC